MQRLKIHLENCYGIKRLEKEFDFTTSKVNAIYARNGLMKTSLTKVFQKIQNNKRVEIRDEIFRITPVVSNIQVDGDEIQKEDIFVIQSFENSYESDSVASLLINSELKQNLSEVIKLKDRFLKLLENKSGRKITKTVQGKKVYDLEPSIIEDFGFNEKSFLLNLDYINIADVNYDYSEIQYSAIYDDSVIKKIKSVEFQTKIVEFLDKSDEIYAEFVFLDKGRFTLPKLKDIEKGLKKNVFFVKENKILLDGGIEITNVDELHTKIVEVERQIHATSEFKEIENLLSDAKGIILKDIIENRPEIIEELKIENLDEFKKKLWFSYIKSEAEKYEELKVNYRELEEIIEQTDIDETPWKEALDIFNKRFTVPFNMEISNLKSSIIGESVPKVLFGFCKDGNLENFDNSNWVRLNRDELDDRNTLSQGERRALYLLNIIFDIQKRKRENQKTLFIIDDIADSFDYKNKYAIVEYLKEISEEDDFYMLILSHNFDFYRTVSSRLGLTRRFRHSVNKCETGVEIRQELYQDKPFIFWKDHLSAKHIVALIPFVRNLIEYGVDKNVNDYPGIDEDFLLLTNVIHLKNDTSNITMGNLKNIYKEYIGKDNFDNSISNNDVVYTTILSLANSITSNDSELENKIIISIAIRLKAEKYMKNIINTSISNFTWKKRGECFSGDKNALMSYINSGSNQTRELYNAYCQIGDINKIKILDSVNIMTPESIHLNSFMYEPILDMDIIELKNLFDNVSGL